MHTATRRETDLNRSEFLDFKDAAGCKNPHPDHRDDGVNEGEAIHELEVEHGQHCFVGKNDATSHADVKDAINNGLNVRVQAHDPSAAISPELGLLQPFSASCV